VLDLYILCYLVTIATVPVPVEEAGRFGIVLLDETHQVTGFEEKPKPGPMECESGVCSASMGVYLFSTATLIRVPAQYRHRELGGLGILNPHTAESLRLLNGTVFNRSAAS
jgi:hypothetical protein